MRPHFELLLNSLQTKQNKNMKFNLIIQMKQTTFGRNTMTTSQELDRAQERAEKAAADLRRTQAELRVTQVSILYDLHGELYVFKNFSFVL